MFCSGTEFYDFWCTSTGKFLSYAILALIIYLLVQGYKAWKKWNEPRDMSTGYTPAPGTFSSAVDETEESDDGSNDDIEKVEGEEEETEELDEEVDSSEEGFEIDLWDEKEIFLAITGITDMTYESLINEYFKLDTSNLPAKIVKYDTGKRQIVFSLTLNTGEIISFRIPLENIEFFADNSLKNPVMEVFFTESFLEEEPDFDSDKSLKENILGIKWDEYVFEIENYTTINIFISEKDHEAIFSK